MNNAKDLNILDLYFRKKKNIMQTADHLILKSSFSSQKSKSFNTTLRQSRNVKFNTPKKEIEKSQIINSNSNNNSNKNKNITKEEQIKIEKFKKILLPSLSSTNKSTYKSVINSKINKKPKESILKLIKIRKLNVFSFTPMKSIRNNKKLKKLYKENLAKKRKLENYKEYKNKNIKNFSLERYNEKLILLSSMNLSEDNFNIFKKNMKKIEKAMNGRETLNNKFRKILDKIENNNTPYNKKSKKYISLSENKTQKEKI